MADNPARTRLPNTRALLAFEAASRLGSFQRAAEDLNATPSAVSHQIATMETLLGAKLFHRHKNRVELTAEGAAYVEDVNSALALLGSATRRFQIASGEKPLRIAAHSLIALNWLFPRLRAFHETFPDIRLDVISSDHPMDLFANEVDLAIDWGAIETAERQGYDVLVRRTATPVCTADFFEKAPLRQPDDLLDVPVLDNLGTSAEWPNWLTAAGSDSQDLRMPYRLGDRSLVIAAMRAGLGVALGCRNLHSAELQYGDLIAPFDIDLSFGDGYFLVASSGLRDVDLYHQVRNWILTQI